MPQLPPLEVKLVSELKYNPALRARKSRLKKSKPEKLSILNKKGFGLMGECDRATIRETD